MLEKLFFLSAGVLLANDKAREHVTSFLTKGTKEMIDILNKKGDSDETSSEPKNDWESKV